MSNKNIMIGGVVVLTFMAVVGVGGGLWAYNFVQGDTLGASGPITAIPLVLSTNVPATDSPTQDSGTVPTEAVAPTTESLSATATTETTASTGGVVIFQIVPEQSEARFSIYEELGGQPKTVIGVTNQVAGELALDLNDLSQTQVGVVQINARTLTTDSDRRNRAIGNFILNTDQYEFITFTPTSLSGLSGAGQAGQPVTFQVVGDLTIRDITQSVTFDVTVTGDSTTQLSGTASTVVTRSAYQLTIPSVPNVANVGEEVTLEFDFVAIATS